MLFEFKFKLKFERDFFVEQLTEISLIFQWKNLQYFRS